MQCSTLHNVLPQIQLPSPLSHLFKTANFLQANPAHYSSPWRWGNVYKDCKRKTMSALLGLKRESERD